MDYDSDSDDFLEDDDLIVKARRELRYKPDDTSPQDKASTLEKHRAKIERRRQIEKEKERDHQKEKDMRKSPNKLSSLQEDQFNLADFPDALRRHQERERERHAEHTRNLSDKVRKIEEEKEREIDERGKAKTNRTQQRK